MLSIENIVPNRIRVLFGLHAKGSNATNKDYIRLNKMDLKTFNEEISKEYL
jgi:hypothetical protein